MENRGLDTYLAEIPSRCVPYPTPENDPRWTTITISTGSVRYGFTLLDEIDVA